MRFVRPVWHLDETVVLRTPAEHQQVIELYAERVACGLAPFTGEPPRPVVPVGELVAQLSPNELALLEARRREQDLREAIAEHEEMERAARAAAENSEAGEL